MDYKIPQLTIHIFNLEVNSCIKVITPIKDFVLFVYYRILSITNKFS